MDAASDCTMTRGEGMVPPRVSWGEEGVAAFGVLPPSRSSLGSTMAGAEPVVVMTNKVKRPVVEISLERDCDAIMFSPCV